GGARDVLDRAARRGRPATGLCALPPGAPAALARQEGRGEGELREGEGGQQGPGPRDRRPHREALGGPRSDVKRTVLAVMLAVAAAGCVKVPFQRADAMRADPI